VITKTLIFFAYSTTAQSVQSTSHLQATKIHLLLFIGFSFTSARIDDAISKRLCNSFIWRAIYVTRAMFSLSAVYINEDKLNKNTMNNPHLLHRTLRRFIRIAPYI